MTAFTVHVSEATAAKLDELAEKLDRPPSEVVARAIEDFVEREAWQLAEIEAGLAEADRGDFASTAELTQVIAKYVKPASQG
ncbi:Transcriptional regulator, CopG family [Bradyrhizobium sp. ORS 285]|uniref:CopG family ribbon-helix-helix protein n=1 Tax=Bradyrhizobium sp. ORS 285 TaxID=115808 RepID=UPI0002406245|nr:CopG family ribbon-helix-helix protein [Bradyrhizobium sp. ORS 285]CCD88381.1 Transcriptional regulator, CopG family [Bradyrhizobium sp. ORS 285]SMX56870.1 Transcriptional regulator, CopG family [Bradyrhizobium sp. ORS 285]